MRASSSISRQSSTNEHHRLLKFTFQMHWSMIGIDMQSMHINKRGNHISILITQVELIKYWIRSSSCCIFRLRFEFSLVPFLMPFCSSNEQNVLFTRTVLSSSAPKWSSNSIFPLHYIQFNYHFSLFFLHFLMTFFSFDIREHFFAFGWLYKQSVHALLLK